MTSHPLWQDRQTFRHSRQEKAVVHSQGPAPALYARGVGGSSVHFTANYWRMRPVDFKERSLLGEISGTGFADWPLSYEELEPYYTQGRLGNRCFRGAGPLRRPAFETFSRAAPAGQVFRCIA